MEELPASLHDMSESKTLCFTMQIDNKLNTVPFTARPENIELLGTEAEVDGAAFLGRKEPGGGLARPLRGASPRLGEVVFLSGAFSSSSPEKPNTRPMKSMPIAGNVCHCASYCYDRGPVQISITSSRPTMTATTEKVYSFLFLFFMQLVPVDS